jgi:hypothetical protein
MAFFFGMVAGAIAVAHPAENPIFATHLRNPSFATLDMLLTEVNHEGQSGSPA